MIFSDFFLGFGIGFLGMVVLCAVRETRIEKRYAKKIKTLEEKAELKAYRQIMKNLTIRKDL